MQNPPLAWFVARRDPVLPLYASHPQRRLCDFSPLVSSPAHLGTPPSNVFCHPEEAKTLTMAPIAQAVTVSLEDLKQGT